MKCSLLTGTWEDKALLYEFLLSIEIVFILSLLKLSLFSVKIYFLLPAESIKFAYIFIFLLEAILFSVWIFNEFD